MNHFRIYWTDLTAEAQEGIKELVRGRINRKEVEEELKNRFEEAGLDIKADNAKSWKRDTEVLVVEEMVDDIINREFDARGEV